MMMTTVHLDETNHLKPHFYQNEVGKIHRLRKYKVSKLHLRPQIKATNPPKEPDQRIQQQ